MKFLLASALRVTGVCFIIKGKNVFVFHVRRRVMLVVSASKTVTSTSANVDDSLHESLPPCSPVNVGVTTSIAPDGAGILPAHTALVTVAPMPGSLVSPVDVSLVTSHDVPVDGTVNTVAAGEGLDLFSDVVNNLVASVAANVDIPDAEPNLQQSASSSVIAQAGRIGGGSSSQEAPVRQSVLGVKRLRSRSRSASRSKSRSPLRKGGRADVLSSDSVSDDALSDEYSLESEVVLSVHGDDDPPSPDNFFASFSGFESTDDPLTQYAANLPCPTQDRVHFLSGPEASQPSEESAFIAKLFSTSASPTGEVEFSE
jgi:hypothetical protein